MNNDRTFNNIVTGEMDVEDIRAIEEVIAHTDFKSKISINIRTIVRSLKNLNLIDECLTQHLSDNYKRNKEDSKGKQLLKLNRFIWEIVVFLSFDDLLRVLCDSGNQLLANSLVVQRGCIKSEDTTALTGVDIPRSVSKYRLPHAEELNRFYIDLKVRVDNNTLNCGMDNGNKESLELMIFNLDIMLNSCDNPARKQFMLDKRVLLYFLLAQVCADFNERMAILKRLHDSMPHGADRFMYKAIYHSNMAVTWAMKGNVKTALEHVAVSREDNFTCMPCLPVYVSMMGAHISHTEVYLSQKSSDYLHKAIMDYESVSQLVQEASVEEQMVWKSGTLLIMASALLGIKFFSKVCDETVDPGIENLTRARNILAEVRRLKSLPKHRELMLYLCIGKLHDIEGNLSGAVRYIQKARDLAEICSFNNTEKENINIYLIRLHSKSCATFHDIEKEHHESPRVRN